MTIVFLVSFPVAFSGISAGLTILDATWRAVGSIALIVFLYVFPRGLFEPRWTAIGCALSAGYLAVRAYYPPLAATPVDLVIFPLTVIVPLALQVTRYRSASNPTDRRRLKLVGAASAAAFGGQLILFGAQFGGWLGPEPSAEAVVEPVSYALALLIPAGLTLALAPLDGKVSGLVARLTPSADNPADLIVRLGALAQGPAPSRELLTFAAEAIQRSLRLPAVSIELADSGARLGVQIRDGRAESWPLTYRGDEIGRLRAQPRSRAGFSTGDREILATLSVQLVPVVGAVHLADQLEAARSRLISVREEERRRLRADLHDELGATLAGLTLKAGLAGNLVETDRCEAQRLLGEIESTLKTAVVHVRQVVEGLRPAQLDELGLDSAIREQVERLVRAGSPMALQVHGHAEPGLPAAVELAAYRIAQEALTNSVRHSRGSRVDIELAVEQLDQILSVKVTDDGIGLSDTAPIGYGIQSMRQRARELGGECSIGRSSTGGVVVTAVLPLPAAGAA